MNRVYLDSCFVIYLLEETPLFSRQARRFFGENSDLQVCVSPLVRLEVLTKPLRDNNVSLVGDYEYFLASLELLSINDEIFYRALHFRARQRLKTPDALHLATAQYHACSEFWTNDDRLKEAAGAMAVNVFTGM
jgi:predicted nucleic acid-binding protein